MYHLRGSHAIQNVSSWSGCYFYTLKEGDVNAKTQKISKIAEWLLRYGQVRYLGKGRRNAYGVYPPAVEEYDNGQKKTPPALCYVSDRMVGIAVLTSYHAGTYKPGDEVMIEKEMRKKSLADTKFFQTLLADYNKAMFSIEKSEEPTFEEVFLNYYRDKYGQEYGHDGKKKQSEYSTAAAFKNSSALHDKVYSSLRKDDFQAVINTVSERLSHSSAELVKFLFAQMDRYALANDICQKGYAGFAQIKIADDDEHGVPFTHNELDLLWKNKDKPFVDTILIYCYSGWRLNELAGMDLGNIDLEEKTFTGGLKNRYSRNRTVPIHSRIYDLVKARYDTKFHSLIYHDGQRDISQKKYRECFAQALATCGITEKHTPHDCRHTCNSLLIEAKADRIARYRIMGHTGQDINEKIYSHMSVEQLRAEIEKIK